MVQKIEQKEEQVQGIDDDNLCVFSGLFVEVFFTILSAMCRISVTCNRHSHVLCWRCSLCFSEFGAISSAGKILLIPIKYLHIRCYCNSENDRTVLLNFSKSKQKYHSENLSDSMVMILSDYYSWKKNELKIILCIPGFTQHRPRSLPWTRSISIYCPKSDQVYSMLLSNSSVNLITYCSQSSYVRLKIMCQLRYTRREHRMVQFVPRPLSGKHLWASWLASS